MSDLFEEIRDSTLDCQRITNKLSTLRGTNDRARERAVQELSNASAKLKASYKNLASQHAAHVTHADPTSSFHTLTGTEQQFSVDLYKITKELLQDPGNLIQKTRFKEAVARGTELYKSYGEDVTKQRPKYDIRERLERGAKELEDITMARNIDFVIAEDDNAQNNERTRDNINTAAPANALAEQDRALDMNIVKQERE